MTAGCRSPGVAARNRAEGEELHARQIMVKQAATKVLVSSDRRSSMTRSGLNTSSAANSVPVPVSTMPGMKNTRGL